jgi:hypothetical protein
MRDIGERLLLSMGMAKDDISDDKIDLAVAANQVFVAKLEEIAGVKGKRDFH